jgi:hypothetical protein
MTSYKLPNDAVFVNRVEKIFLMGIASIAHVISKPALQFDVSNQMHLSEEYDECTLRQNSKVLVFPNVFIFENM